MWLHEILYAVLKCLLAQTLKKEIKKEGKKEKIENQFSHAMTELFIAIVDVITARKRIIDFENLVTKLIDDDSKRREDL